MQKEHWKIYSKEIDRIAGQTYRGWMSGVDFTDIKQEIWTEFFRVHPSCKTQRQVIQQLKIFSKSYVKEAGDNILSAEDFSLCELKSSAEETHWKYVYHAWDTFKKKLSKKEITLIDMVTLGKPNRTIAESLLMSLRSVRRLRPLIINKFKKEFRERHRLA